MSGMCSGINPYINLGGPWGVAVDRDSETALQSLQSLGVPTQARKLFVQQNRWMWGRYTGIRYTGIRVYGIRVYGYTVIPYRGRYGAGIRVYGIRVYGIRYTVICPFLQKMKVLRIAQPGRQNLN